MAQKIAHRYDVKIVDFTAILKRRFLIRSTMKSLRSISKVRLHIKRIVLIYL